MAFRSLSTLKNSRDQTWREDEAQLGNVLVSTVNGNVNGGVLVDISEPQVSSDDEFLRLESWSNRSSQGPALRDSRQVFRLTGWDEHPVPVGLSALSNDPLDDVWDSRACLTLVQPSGILSDRINAPEPIPMTYFRSESAHRKR